MPAPLPPKKKHKQGPIPLERVYQDVTFDKRPATGRPDSPSFFFHSSHTVSLSKIEDVANSKNDGETAQSSNSASPNMSVPQIVHQHLNGLCIVTAGEIARWLPQLYPNHELHDLQFIADEAPACSAAEKRKRQSKMLRGAKVEHAVMPSTVIAKLKLKEKGKATEKDDNKQTTVEVPLYACAWGTIIELNKDLTPSVLMEDALLDGHIAIIQPSGRFPPPPSQSTTIAKSVQTAEVAEKDPTDAAAGES